jgi:hypothetical protein
VDKNLQTRSAEVRGTAGSHTPILELLDKAGGDAPRAFEIWLTRGQGYDLFWPRTGRVHHG